MQGFRPVALQPLTGILARLRAGIGHLDQPFDQGAHIHARPATQDRQSPASPRLFHRRQRLLAPPGHAARHRGVQHAIQSMGCDVFVFSCGTRGQNAQIAIDLHGISIDDMAAKSYSQFQRESRLAGTSRSRHNQTYRGRRHGHSLPQLPMSLRATMSFPYALTLVADRTATTLTHEVIDIACHMLKGGAPVVLSPGEAVDIPCPGPVPGAPTAATLRTIFARHKVDALLVKTRGRRKAVLVADMDSTIIANETLDDIAAHLGVGEEVRLITEASMNGEIDFESALRARVALLEGKPAAVLHEVLGEIVIREDAATLVRTMKAHRARTALVSGGFTFFTDHVAGICGFDENHGNVLEIRDGILTGRLAADVLGPESKLHHLENIAEERGVKLGATLTTGDGANDLPMLQAAGLGIAYHGKPIVREAVSRQVNFAGLRSLLFAQGYPASDFVS